MEKMDKNVLLDLVNKYGVEEIEKFIDIKEIKND